MPMLTLARAARISGSFAAAFVGAGGKTTAMLRLAREAAPALVCSTAHLGARDLASADRHLAPAGGEGVLVAEPAPSAGVTVVTGPFDPAAGLWKGLERAELHSLYDTAGRLGLPLLVEADCAHQRPLKAPECGEWTLPAAMEAVFVVAGLGGLGRRLDAESVCGPERFARWSGLRPGDPITAEAVARVLAQAGGRRSVALLNQADTPALRAEGSRIAGGLLAAYRAVIVSDLRHPATVHAVYERVAGIVLAAGAAKRFGSPKQLLCFRGRPFVRAVAETALASGLWPVVVVTGCAAEEVEAAVGGLSVECARNPQWMSGLGSSIRTGMERLPPETGAVVFLLADQPQATAEVVGALVQRHAAGLFPIVAPRAAGRRANPVLFDRETFGDLRRLAGDMGGRALFEKYGVEDLPWNDPALLLDVDTPEDLGRVEG